MKYFLADLERIDDPGVGLVFEVHQGTTDWANLIHVRFFNGTEVTDSDQFFEVISASR